jgi:Flp pilus assembly protein TadD
LALVAIATLALGGLWLSRTQGSLQPAVAQYVGASACATCHKAAYQAWQGSHHDLAMQVATAATVLAPFQGERFTETGVTSVFSQRNGKYYVRTEGLDGRLQDFEVSHTLGLTPLQQYLIPMPDQGMQALTIAWDTRPKAQGGQRWFHLYAGQAIRAGDPLHWTGRQNNWNFMCAECHTTQFKKNFDPQTRRYASTWSEGNVACEACHGPGSLHISWAAQSAPDRLSDNTYGLVQALHERTDVHWEIQSETGNAKRSVAPATQRPEVEMCARCHAHRSQISDDYVHGKPLLDTHVPSLLNQGLFWGDGQMKAEVYNYASFQQSRMYQKGVTCSDCHSPHTLKLRAPGSQTCLQCHAAGQYAAATHHFHKSDSAGASCAGCHMPTTTYMSIDPRHDHSIRVPRPDLSLTNGTPNACNTCHTGTGVPWAAQWASKWYPTLHQRQTPLDHALLASDRGDPQALPRLWGIVQDHSQSSIARATAVSRMAASREPAQLERVAAQLADPDPLVRKTAVDALADTAPAARARWLKPLLGDPVKAVRTAAARWLVGVPTADWSAGDLSALQTALNEYQTIQRFNADRPEAYNNLGMLYADQHDWPRAEAALQQAIAMDADLTASSLNLADVYREQGRETQAQALIQQVIARHPGDAAAHHAWGLSLLRQQRGREALKALHEATRLQPDNPAFAYVYTALAAQCRRNPSRDCKP